MRFHILLNAFNELRNRDKLLGCVEHFITFRNAFSKSNNHMSSNIRFSSIYPMILELL